MRGQRGSPLRESALAPFKTALLLLALAGLGFALWVERPTAAFLCPTCFGLGEVAPGVHVDDPALARRALAAIAGAEERVARALGPVDLRTVFLICGDRACERRVAGRAASAGVAAATYGWSFVRVTPRGLNETVLAHELAHVAINRRVGAAALVAGRLPAWWNEGLASLIAEGLPASCPRETGVLPQSRAEWRAAVASGQGNLYRRAACRTAHWLDANGGFEGALAALEALRRGRPFPL